MLITTAQAALIAVAVFVVALIGLTYWKASQHRPPPVAQQYGSEGQAERSMQRDNAAQDDQYRTETAAAPKQDGPPQNMNTGTSHPPSEKESTEAALALYTWWLTAFTGVLALATLALVVATTGLWHYAAEQASDMKESIEVSRKSAIAAEHSALAALKSAEIAVKSQSASVIIDHMEQTYGRAKGAEDGFVIQAVFRNAGVTVARNTSANIAFHITDMNPDLAHLWDGFYFDQNIGAEVGANVSFKTAEVFLSMNTIKEMWDKKKRAFVGVAVQYETIFEPGVFITPPPHLFEIQAFWNPNQGIPPDGRILRFNGIPKN